LGTVHFVPCPPLSGAVTGYRWRRRLLWRELAVIQPAVVHGQGTELEYGLTAVTGEYPHVLTIHGMLHKVHRVTKPPVLSLQHVPRWVEKQVVRRARHVICISRAVAEFLDEFKSPARRHHIPNAVAPCFFDVRRAARTTAPRQVLFVGSLYKLKGLHILLEALGQLRARSKVPFNFSVVGSAGASRQETGYVASLCAQSAALGLDNIQWLGTRNEVGVAAALAGTDLLVLPSFQESAPMCLAEAMAAGVPVVASAVGGVPDMVEHGREGLLVPPGEPAPLAQALQTILENSALGQQMGAAGRARAEAHYRPRSVAEKTLAVYQQVCTGTWAGPERSNQRLSRRAATRHGRW
jgi:glycosyltransferase involved in cell wall biosynthesis